MRKQPKKISKTLSKIIDKELAKQPIPVKTANGILIGDVEIISEGSLKHLRQSGRIKYNGIFLNATAITLANMLALRKDKAEINKIYKADQAYGLYYVDSQQLRIRYNQAVEDNDAFGVDMFWARYTERCDRVNAAKLIVEKLIENE